MPIFKESIEYFTCKFKCGEKARPLNTMEKHEAKCFCNPETRSCRICKHYIVNPDYVSCSVNGYEVSNGATYHVYQKDKLIWDHTEEVMKQNKDIFYPTKERPFPRTNCIQFELGKKAY